MTARSGPRPLAPPDIAERAPASHPHARIPIVVAVGASVALRLPTLFDPHYYTDEGIFAAVAQRLLQGHALYAGSWDDKPPLIFWLYALIMAAFGPSMPAIRIAATAAAAAAAAAVGLLATRMAGRRAGIQAALLCAAFMATPMVEGNLALTELFGAAPAAWAMVLVITSDRPRVAREGVAGALLACAFLFKQVYALDAMAAGVVLLAHGRQGLRRLTALAGGFAAVVLVVAVILAVQRGLADGLYASFGFYLLYLGEGSGSHPQRWAVAVLAAATALMLWRRHLSAAPCLPQATVWLVFAELAVLIGGRPYGHYLIQAAAPFALWSAVLIRRGLRWDARWVAFAAVGVAASVLVVWSFRPYFLRDRTVSTDYYVNLLRLLTGSQDRAGFRHWYTWRVAAQEQLAEVIRADSERTLFAWGEYPWLYPLAEAENPTRFPTSFHLSFVPGSREEAMTALRQRPPRFIIWEGDEWRRLPGLEELLDERYELVTTIYESRLYRRR